MKFELAAYENGGNARDAKEGLQGAVGRFGYVIVEHAKVYRRAERGMDSVRLSGPSFPVTVFRGKRRNSQPSLAKAELTLDARPVGLRFNSRAVRKQDRALRISYDGREYIYSSDGMGKPNSLVRDGVRITLELGDFIPSVGMCRNGEAVGPVDPVDLAIAIVLEEVDTDALTLSGAALSSPFALMHHLSDTAE
ncbi:hypothetical protein ACWIGD_07700 [Streptomyces albidoflavus]|uniref:hypothetical protein n=1 Tax=Streptomyces sp. BI87 TaxID=2987521 RepID=UPI0022232FE6|nr:hypothetical protein [Streptomyces sp. BI87]UYX97444.1 hypothetical protein OIM89_28715 [Streptomyces sp. BI87]